ncbi:hypothetical protein D1872_204750 [compost metagenome]
MHVIFVNAANFKSSDAQIFTNPMILVDYVISYLQLGIAFYPLCIIHTFTEFTRFSSFLREHFTFCNHNQMNRRKLKSGLQITLHQHWLINAVIQQHPPHAIHPLFSARKHDHLGSALLPPFHFRFQKVHLPMEILHRSCHKIDNILWLDMGNLPQEQR